MLLRHATRILTLYENTRYRTRFFLSIPLFLSAHSANLPEPGLTPESRLYFFEQIAESIQEFFTFDAEAKALLHASLAKERIAEIDNMLDEVGVEAKGLSIAEDRLERHLARATEFVSRKADKGGKRGRSLECIEYGY